MKLLSLLFLIVSSFESLAQEEIRIKSIYFGGGSYFIDEQQLAELDEFIRSIDNPDQYQITITSHTDNIGGIEYNQWLSEMRSEAVIHQLMNHLPERERIHVENMGLHDPRYRNDTYLGRRANRRVDVIFTPIVL